MEKLRVKGACVEERTAMVCSQVLQTKFVAVPANKHPLEFFRNPKTNLFFKPDVYCQSLRIVVEYNGPYHYSCYKTMRRDAVRKEVLDKNRIKLLVINFWVQSLLPIYIMFRFATEWGCNSIEACLISRSKEIVESFERRRTVKGKKYDFCQVGQAHYVLCRLLQKWCFEPVEASVSYDLEQKMLSFVANVKHLKRTTVQKCPSVVMFLWFQAQEKYSFQTEGTEGGTARVHIPVFMVTKKNLEKYVLARLIDIYGDGLGCRLSARNHKTPFP